MFIMESNTNPQFSLICIFFITNSIFCIRFFYFRLFACYNDGIINLLEKYFEMNKKQVNESTVNHVISGVYILIFDHGGGGGMKKNNAFCVV